MNTTEYPGDRHDVFNAWLIRGAVFDGDWEMPCIATTDKLPEKCELIPFDKIRPNTDRNQWVHFYAHDHTFEKLWNSPQNYLEKLQSFQGVISPDYSLYRDMPLAMQLWNTYRNRALGSWLSMNGVPVIPNVRWADERSYDFCFDGLAKGSTVAIGTHGCVKSRDDKHFFKQGLEEMLNRLSPHTVVVYGAAPTSIFSSCVDAGIRMIEIPSLFDASRKKEVL